MSRNTEQNHEGGANPFSRLYGFLKNDASPEEPGLFSSLIYEVGFGIPAGRDV